MSAAGITPLLQCLACGGDQLELYFDAGDQPLANAFTDGSAALSAYPLKLNVCTTCWHSQQSVAVDPVVLFTDYPYVSGTSETLRRYFSAFVRRVEGDFPVNADVLKSPWEKYQPPTHRRLRVLDIASNDGSLLKEFKARGHTVLGVDPAQNLRAVAGANGVPTITTFWNKLGCELVEADPRCPFDVIVAMNVLGHVADPLAFLRLAKRVLAPGGRIYVQTSQANMVKNCEFDTVYHEHLSFFTAESWLRLVNRAGLLIRKIEIADIHGGSYLLELQDGGDLNDAGDTSATRRASEQAQGLYDLETYKSFQWRATAQVDLLRQAIWVYLTANRQKRRLVGYGAAAKAMTFLNYGKFKLDYIVDDNPLKIGKLCPGSGTPVVSSGVLRDEPGPLLIIVTAWNFKREIIERVKALRPDRRGDIFLTYFPTISVC